jgi:3-phenylpropionate/trans-cinnamate dioxygenase ferredoxin reductase subunit
MSGHVVIVGAGHAGGSVAAFLRQFGYADPITLAGAEPLAPYQRPPLSKGWLKGEVGADELLLKPEHWYGENQVDLRLSSPVASLDLSGRMVELADGHRVGWDRLVIATGARARALSVPGADLYGVLALRAAADAEALKTTLAPGRRLAVIGGGYVGLEAAASARALGAEAVVIEREARVLARVACRELSDFFTAYHRARGVTFELGADVQALEEVDGRVAGVRLGDGRLLPCDAALVGVGAIPNDELAREAGLACDGGIVVDAQAHTSAPDVWAVGDVTRRPLPFYEDRPWRLESVPNALEQARQAACAIAERPPPPPETPWFWSDQYDLKLQIAGLPFEADRRVVRGDPATARFAVFHLMGARLRAVEAVNAAPEFMAGRQLISRGTAVDAERLADATTPLKSLLA